MVIDVNFDEFTRGVSSSSSSSTDRINKSIKVIQGLIEEDQKEVASVEVPGLVSQMANDIDNEVKDLYQSLEISGKDGRIDAYFTNSKGKSVRAIDELNRVVDVYTKQSIAKTSNSYSVSGIQSSAKHVRYQLLNEFHQRTNEQIINKKYEALDAYSKQCAQRITGGDSIRAVYSDVNKYLRQLKLSPSSERIQRSSINQSLATNVCDIWLDVAPEIIMNNNVPERLWKELTPGQQERYKSIATNRANVTIKERNEELNLKKDGIMNDIFYGNISPNQTAFEIYLDSKPPGVELTKTQYEQEKREAVRLSRFREQLDKLPFNSPERQKIVDEAHSDKITNYNRVVATEVYEDSANYVDSKNPLNANLTLNQRINKRRIQQLDLGVTESHIKVLTKAEEQAFAREFNKVNEDFGGFANQLKALKAEHGNQILTELARSKALNLDKSALVWLTSESNEEALQDYIHVLEMKKSGEMKLIKDVQSQKDREAHESNYVLKKVRDNIEQTYGTNIYNLNTITHAMTDLTYYYVNKHGLTVEEGISKAQEQLLDRRYHTFMQKHSWEPWLDKYKVTIPKMVIDKTGSKVQIDANKVQNYITTEYKKIIKTHDYDVTASFKNVNIYDSSNEIIKSLLDNIDKKHGSDYIALNSQWVVDENTLVLSLKVDKFYVPLLDKNGKEHRVELIKIR